MADDLHTPASLYDRDFVAWTVEQARALRTRRGGENALDYDNLAEEIEDLGKSEIRACLSLIDRIVEHLLKIEYIGGQDLPNWKGEIRAFRRSLARTLTPSITRQIQPQTAEAAKEAAVELAERGLLDTATPPRVDIGYSWDQITDPDWYPAPAGSD